jgi:Asp-tRNA(Asn)/Glu-tRNA(Gln) amidotransferase A subunit family amidase
MTAPPLLEGTPTFAEVAARTSAALCFNTAPLNLTGHPAISLPSGADDGGLPTAVQVVAAHFQEATAFRAAFELERAMGPFVAA